MTAYSIKVILLNKFRTVIGANKNNKHLCYATLIFKIVHSHGILLNSDKKFWRHLVIVIALRQLCYGMLTTHIFIYKLYVIF